MTLRTCIKTRESEVNKRQRDAKRFHQLALTKQSIGNSMLFTPCQHKIAPAHHMTMT